MSKRSFRTALVIVSATLLLLAAVAGWAVFRVIDYPERRHSGRGDQVEVVVAKGLSFPAIAELLHQRGVIANPRWFRMYAMHRGATTKVRSGRYVLRDDQTAREVLDALLRGGADASVRVTIPEGLHRLEVFSILAKNGVAEASDLEKLARDPEFLAEHGIDGDSVEGYLFPETYRFRLPTPPRQVLSSMIRQFRLVWERVRRDHGEHVESLRRRTGWSEHQIVVMASIVEKEAVADRERPRIAQVFINRLTHPSFRPRRLETDPTIRYGCTVPKVKSQACRQWDPSQRLRTAQLRDRDNPYNTYQRDGLPPGPICSPGEASLRATVRPDGSKYFYFVSRNDGTHVFSRTLAQHEAAVDRFQR